MSDPSPTSELEAALSAAFLHQHDLAPVAILNGQHDILFSNPAWSKICDKQSLSRLPDAFKKNTPQDITLLHDWPSEGQFLSWQVHHLKNKEGQCEGTWLRGKGSPDLQRQISEYHKMINASKDGLTLIDREYRYQLCNDAFTATKNMSKKEVMGQTISSIWGELTFQKYIRPHLDRSFAGDIVNYQIWIQFSEDNRRYMDVTYWPFFEDGSVTHVVVNSHDITNMKVSEMELKENLKKAEMASLVKSQFLANMSHELRTPLNGIIGSASLIESEELNEEQNDYFKIIKTSADALLALVNDILDNAKIEAGKMDLDNISFSPRNMLDEINELFTFLANGKGISFYSMIDSALPQQLCGDPGRLKQVIVNIVNNALKFTQDGEVSLTVEVLPEENNLLPLKFKIQDTGIGMPPETVSRLFSPYEQGDGSITRKYGGTGLGLHISKSLCELMQGEIGVASTEGEGSEFWFIVRLEAIPDINQILEMASLSSTNILLHHPFPNALDHELGPLHISSLNIETTESIDFNPLSDPDIIVICDDHLGASEPNLEHYKMTFPKAKFVYQTREGIRGDAKKAWSMGYHSYYPGSFDEGVFKKIIEKLTDGTPEQLVTKFSCQEQTRRTLDVLVCEDNPVNVKVVTKILEKLGFSVQVAEDGVKGLAATRAQVYDLILMDLRMPEMDGIEATKRIRKDSLNQNTVIIALTGDAVSGVRETCLEAGMNEFLSKPYTRHQLSQMIQSIDFKFS